MEEIDHEESLLVANVVQTWRIVEVLKTVDEGFGTPEREDELGHVVRGVERVQPGRAFVGFMAILTA